MKGSAHNLFRVEGRRVRERDDETLIHGFLLYGAPHQVRGAIYQQPESNRLQYQSSMLAWMGQLDEPENYIKLQGLL